MIGQVTGTREEVLSLIRRRGPQTADALGHQIGISAVSIRKHLSILERKGLVGSTTQRGPVGRPARLYSVTSGADEVLPSGHDVALLSLLRQVRRVGGEELLVKVLEGRLAEMEAAYRERAGGATTLEARVSAISRVRDEQGYMASWEREDDHYVLAENNCALCRAVQEFPQICALEMGLIKRALGDGVTLECTEHMLRGARRCVFVVHERPS